MSSKKLFPPDVQLTEQQLAERKRQLMLLARNDGRKTSRSRGRRLFPGLATGLAAVALAVTFITHDSGKTVDQAKLLRSARAAISKPADRIWYTKYSVTTTSKGKTITDGGLASWSDQFESGWQPTGPQTETLADSTGKSEPFITLDEILKRYQTALQNRQMNYRGERRVRGKSVYVLVTTQGGTEFTYLISQQTFLPVNAVAKRVAGKSKGESVTFNYGKLQQRQLNRKTRELIQGY